MEEIIHIGDAEKIESLELLNHFTRTINQLASGADPIFQVRKRFPVKIFEIYRKLQGTDKVLFIGKKVEKELVAIMLSRVEEKPFLKEEKILYIDIAVTKKGKENKGYMSSLLQFTENWAKENGFPVIELRVISPNLQALQFWERKGYREFYRRFRKTEF
ncbi:MAG: GNAT family N-acetyltransferase [Leptospiraceae bacterium]|nr:GNAT family N-acetyltransferase [Leptospiraceae bacterium]MCP5499229.1 GNAT family N-acetyltransferase [Leptospiraceae bacterium]